MLYTYIKVSHALPSQKYQFQCVKHQGYELCWHPDEYCYTDKNHSECRQCTKDICQRMNTEDFPLQCWPKCAAGKLFLFIYSWKLTKHSRN